MRGLRQALLSAKYAGGLAEDDAEDERPSQGSREPRCVVPRQKQPPSHPRERTLAGAAQPQRTRFQQLAKRAFAEDCPQSPVSPLRREVVLLLIAAPARQKSLLSGWVNFCLSTFTRCQLFVRCCHVKSRDPRMGSKDDKWAALFSRASDTSAAAPQEVLARLRNASLFSRPPAT